MVYDFVIYILVYKKNKQEILQQNFAKIYSTKSQLTRDFHSPPFLEEKGCISGNFSPPALQLKDSVYHIHFPFWQCISFPRILLGNDRKGTAMNK